MEGSDSAGADGALTAAPAPAAGPGAAGCRDTMPDNKIGRGEVSVSQTERLYKIKRLRDTGGCAIKATLLAQLGVSPATLLRDRRNAPVRRRPCSTR